MTETPHPHAVFWIDLAKITPNPYQPRKFFDPQKLQDLSDSIRRYGVLQPIVVTRNEEFTQEGGMVAKYEIIAGERRFRASKLAGLEKVPAIIREGEQTDLEKLELAILENLQREDLTPVDKARSFNRLVTEFDHTHAQVAEALGKSREYVSNSLRLLQLPDYILDALAEGKISEGHTRPLLMLKERLDEQKTLFMQMTSTQGMTVRDAEKFARSIATEKQRKNKDLDPEMKEIQQRLASHLGTKVSIDKKSQGGKLTIEFGNKDDLRQLFEKIQAEAQIITERTPETAVVASTGDIGFTPTVQDTSVESVAMDVAAYTQETQSFAKVDQSALTEVKPVPAYMSESVRTLEKKQDFVEDISQISLEQAPVSPDMSALQQEIYSLAETAKPDVFNSEPVTQKETQDDLGITKIDLEPSFDTQSQYSYRQTVERDVPAEPVESIENKFGFSAPRVDNAAPSSVAHVDMVSDNSLSTFGEKDTPDYMQNVNSVTVGNDFVPQSTQSTIPSNNAPVAQSERMTQSWGSMTSNQVNLQEGKPEEDVDLYRLDDFSV